MTQCFCQTNGVAIEFPLGGPSLSKILMNITNNPNTRYMRYVHEYFVTTSCKKLLFLKLNVSHEAVKFTNKCEANNHIAFFDMLIIKQDGKFKTKVYIKSNKKQILKFSILLQQKQKFGLIKTLYSRAEKICSPEFLENELINLRTLLKLNGYS